MELSVALWWWRAVFDNDNDDDDERRLWDLQMSDCGRNVRICEGATKMYSL